MTTAVEFAHCEKVFFAKLRELGFDASTILDIGGSNASWSTVVSEVFPDATFEMFEPLAGRQAEYDRVLAWAMRTYPSLRLHPIALGDQNGETEFWPEPSGYGSSMIVSKIPVEQRIKVPVRRLDDYMAEKGLPQPQIIKADVQGGEAQVIQGGLKTFAAADVLLLETWLVRCYGPGTPLLTELIPMLQPLGHVLVQLGDFWRREDELLASVDAMFVHRRLIDRLNAVGNGYPWPPNWSFR